MSDDDKRQHPKAWGLAKGHIRPYDSTFAPWQFSAAYFSHKWHDDSDVTEVEYDAAVQFVLDITLG